MKIKPFLAKYLSVSAIFVIGVLLNMLIYVIAVFAVYGVANFMLEKTKHKIHAKKLFGIKGFYICAVISPCMILICGIAIKQISGTICDFNAILFGLILIAFTCVSVSKLFWGDYKGDNENIKTKNRVKAIFETKTKTEILKLLEELPENEAKAVYLLDFEGKTVNQAADLEMHCSPRMVSELRQKAYKRLYGMFN